MPLCFIHRKIEYGPVGIVPHCCLFTDANHITLNSNQSILITMSDTYYNPKDLKKFEDVGEFGPELAEKFFDYYGAVFEEGALSAREKALIALAVSHTVQCPYCIDAYTSESLEKGASEEQMMEAVHVASAIRGGSSLVHGVQMMNKTKDLSM